MKKRILVRVYLLFKRYIWRLLDHIDSLLGPGNGDHIH